MEVVVVAHSSEDGKSESEEQMQVLASQFSSAAPSSRGSSCRGLLHVLAPSTYPTDPLPKPWLTELIRRTWQYLRATVATRTSCSFSAPASTYCRRFWSTNRWEARCMRCSSSLAHSLFLATLFPSSSLMRVLPPFPLAHLPRCFPPSPLVRTTDCSHLRSCR